MLFSIIFRPSDKLQHIASRTLHRLVSDLSVAKTLATNATIQQSISTFTQHTIQFEIVYQTTTNTLGILVRYLASLPNYVNTKTTPLRYSTLNILN